MAHFERGDLVDAWDLWITACLTMIVLLVEHHSNKKIRFINRRIRWWKTRENQLRLIEYDFRTQLDLKAIQLTLFCQTVGPASILYQLWFFVWIRREYKWPEDSYTGIRTTLFRRMQWVVRTFLISEPKFQTKRLIYFCRVWTHVQSLKLRNGMKKGPLHNRKFDGFTRRRCENKCRNSQSWNKVMHS